MRNVSFDRKCLRRNLPTGTACARGRDVFNKDVRRESLTADAVFIYGY
jgi:hypothetical protein